MSHELEFINGEASMAYAGEKPWHSLGTKVLGDLTPEQMLKAAKLDWTVRKVPAFAEIGGEKVNIGYSALVRDSDDKQLDVVSNDWNPVQNQEAFDFFEEYIKAGDMSMETAGSLKGGTVVWGMAKINEEFEIFGGDRITSNLLFTNFHKYGFSTDIRFTPVRTVCWNTLSLALKGNSDKVLKVSHRNTFNSDMVKETLGIATQKLEKYKEAALFLGSKQAVGEDLIEYFNRVFPKTPTKKLDQVDEMSRNAKIALEILPSQPGYEFAEGSWWQAFNASTFVVDHVLGRSEDNRLHSAWYGAGRSTKNDALNLALEMAEAS